MIRALIVDDSLLVRTVLRDLLGQDPQITVVGEADNGLDAVQKTLELKPNIVIMDLLMPVMDGLDAVIEIMSECPTPILMLSESVDQSGAGPSAFNAIRFGALDVMAKPAGLANSGFGPQAKTLVEKVKVLSRIRVMHHFKREKRFPVAEPPPALGPRKILAIGASTGGPKAVMQIMSELPAGCDAWVLIVQHIAKGFSSGFAAWLDKESSFRVRLAEHGDTPEKGVALVAPDHFHTEFRDGRIVLSDAPPVHNCRPAVDPLFMSLSRSAIASETVAVLLTGMGTDGANGLGALRRAGAMTIAEDEETCAIYGMPRAAIERDAALMVVPLPEIAPLLAGIFNYVEPAKRA